MDPKSASYSSSYDSSSRDRSRFGIYDNDDGGVRKRESRTAVRLRRNKREDLQDRDPQENIETASTDAEMIMEDIAGAVMLLHNATPEIAIPSLQYLAEVTSDPNKLKVIDLFQSNLIDSISPFLSYFDFPQCQIAVLSILANISTKIFTFEASAIVFSSCGLLLPQLLQSPNLEIVEKAASVIGNVGDARDQVINYLFSLGVVDPIIAFFNNPNLTPTQRLSSLHALRCLCGGRDRPSTRTQLKRLEANESPFSDVEFREDLEKLTAEFPHIASYLWDDSPATLDIVTSCLNRLAFRNVVALSNLPNNGIDDILLQHLQNIPNNKIQTRILVLFGCFINMGLSYTQHLVNKGIVPILSQLLLSTQFPDVQTEIAWVSAGIIVGSHDLARLVLDVRIPYHFIQMKNKLSTKGKLEFSYLLVSLLKKYGQCAKDLINQGMVPCVVELLQEKNDDTIYNSLQCLYLLMNMGIQDMHEKHQSGDDDATNLVEDLIHRVDGVTAIAQFTNDRDDNIRELSQDICDLFTDDPKYRTDSN